MIALLIVAQLAAAAGLGDSTYATSSLRELITAAAAANRAPPAPLSGYRARIESELSLLVRDSLGREQAAQVEQLAMSAHWTRSDGAYDLHVIGYRAQSVGVPYSALSFARSWTVPYLYGDRFTLGVDMARGIRFRRGEARADSNRSAEPFRAIHPLARDRERYYVFSGGDTVAVIRAQGRAIPIVRVRVTPHFPRNETERLAAFDGELDLDAVRHQIVRMRGMFVANRPLTGRRAILARLPGVVGVAFVEFINGERLGRYWLPTYQRAEFQASFAALGPQRSVFRLVSRFDDVRVSEDSSVMLAKADSETVLSTAGEDTAGYHRRLTFASTDSISRFSGWKSSLGKETARVSASDFDDMAPDAWRATGAPRIELAARSVDDLFRYDRVEGAYTGAAVAVRFRDRAPGLTARAFGGWAWTESTPRGGVALSLSRAQWLTTVRAERVLTTTNDFTGPLDGSAGFAALLGAPDDQDYVDQRIAALSATRIFGSVDRALASAELALGADHNEVARLQSAPLWGTPFRPNRASDEGRYVRGRAVLEWHPDVTGIFLEPGVGARASYEIGRGQLNWQRIDLVLAARHQLSDITLSTRAEGGVVLGRTPPPQVLFELGGEGPLPGYSYKEFGGDRAAIAGVLASYTTPLLRRPWHLVRSLVLPGLSPGIALGVQSGWAEISNDGARSAMARMMGSCNPAMFTCTAPELLSRPTDGVRATVDVRLTVFGGVLGVGVARPVDRAAPWRLVFRAGQEF